MTITLAHTTPDGNTFSYEITGITRRCWVICAEHTGEVRQYQSKAALRSFCRRLADHLDAKYPVVATGESIALAMAA